MNILVNPKQKDCVGFLQTINTLSFSSMNDGCGFYADNGDLCVKSENLIDFTKYAESLNKSNFILCHSRLTTSGKGEDYLHPFENADFSFIMNGVVSEYAKDEHSDTYGLFEEFKKLFEENSEADREKKIVNAINKIYDELSGSFSCALFDKTTRRLYYWKNFTPNIFFYAINGSLFITTSRENDMYSYLMGKQEEAVKIEIADYEIISIYLEENKKKEVCIFYKTIGYLKEKVYFTYSEHKKEKKNKRKKNKNLEEQLNSEKFSFPYPVHEGFNPTCEIRQTAQDCYMCHMEVTYNFFPDWDMRVCDNCVREGVFAGCLDCDKFEDWEGYENEALRQLEWEKNYK